MMKCVILKLVAFLDDLSRKMRILLNALPDAKKGCPCIVTSKDFQDFRGMVRIGTIIESDPDLFLGGCKMGFDLTEPGTISPERRQEYGSCGAQ